MADQHRATAGEWYCIKDRASGKFNVAYSAIHELLCRIEALEATQSGSIDLSHLSDAEREKILKMLANPGRFEVLEVAQPAKSNHLEKPDSSLVERVADAIVAKATSAGIVNDRPARAAIREVAVWLQEQKSYGHGWAAITLEQEAKR